MVPIIPDRCFGRPFQALGEFNLESMISRITLETAYGPTMVFDSPFAPSPPNPVLSRLRPRITIGVRGISAPIVAAPYGAPPPTIWPEVVAGGTVVGGILLVLAGIGAYHLARRGS